MKCEKKFIVINKKHLTEEQLLKLNILLATFALPNNKYYVVNQDESYAGHVWEMIKENEEYKEAIQESFEKLERRGKL